MSQLSQQEKIIKSKVGLLESTKELGNVSNSWLSRDTFYRYKELRNQGGEVALLEISRRKPIIKNRVADYVEKAVIDVAIEYPAYGQERASNELKKKGILVSPSGIRSMEPLKNPS